MWQIYQSEEKTSKHLESRRQSMLELYRNLKSFAFLALFFFFFCQCHIQFLRLRHSGSSQVVLMQLHFCINSVIAVAALPPSQFSGILNKALGGTNQANDTVHQSRKFLIDMINVMINKCHESMTFGMVPINPAIL